MRLSTKLLSATAGAAIAMCATPALAAGSFLFELSPVAGGSRSASFVINTDVAPNFANTTFVGSQLRFDNIMGTFGGIAQTASIGFGTGSIAAFQITNNSTLGFTQFSGPALFTGSPSMPIFNIGTFTLPGGFTQATSTLRISQVAAAVPEPVTWAMMLAGFAMIGAAMRSRKPKVTFAQG